MSRFLMQQRMAPSEAPSLDGVVLPELAPDGEFLPRQNNTRPFLPGTESHSETTDSGALAVVNRPPMATHHNPL